MLRDIRSFTIDHLHHNSAVENVLKFGQVLTYAAVMCDYTHTHKYINRHMVVSVAKRWSVQVTGLQPALHTKYNRGVVQH